MRGAASASQIVEAADDIGTVLFFGVSPSASSEDSMSETWGPRAHPEKCDEWAEQDALKRTLDRSASRLMWIVLIGSALAALWWVR